MILQVRSGSEIDSGFISNYFNSLVNSFFKILPMKEDEEETLPEYLLGLQRQMLGCKNLVDAINNNAEFVTLLSILQYFIDNPDCETSVVKSQVFTAIHICKKLSKIYAGGGESK